MISEYIAQMAPMLGIAAGSVAWLAQIPMTRRGFGFLPDMALGLFGSAIFGILAAAAIFPFAGGFGMIGMFVVGTIGAAIAIGAQRGVWPGQRRDAS